MATRNTSVFTIPRFQGHCRMKVWSMALLDDERVAITGYNGRTNDTFVDLFMIDPDSEGNTTLGASRRCYSKEFIYLGSISRSVCLLDDHRLVTCCGNKIELYDTSHPDGGQVKEGNVVGDPVCMTTKGDCLYIGLFKSNRVITFDFQDLSTRDTITLLELKPGEWPDDMAVSTNKLFVCTGGCRRALMCTFEGAIEHEYKKHQYKASSVTVSEKEGFTFILWIGGMCNRVVHVYSSFGVPSITGGHILASYNCPDDFWRIRINENVNRLYMVTRETGELHILQILNLPQEVVEKTKLCLEETKQKLEESKQELEKTKSSLRDTKQELEVSQLKYDKEVRALQEVKKQAKETLDKKELEMEKTKSSLRDTKQELTASQVKYDKEVKALQEVLKQTKETLDKKELELEKTKSSLRDTKQELEVSQLKYDKEVRALQEVKKQAKETLDKKELVISASVTEGETIIGDREARDLSQESNLAADFGRLLVSVADDLTLDSTLKLATLFGLPIAEIDMLRRVSQVEIPGLTLIDYMKTRNIINMYDVTNLQNGLMWIQLNKTNTDHLDPYQSKVDDFQFEEHQLPVLLEWPAENEQVDTDSESCPSQASEAREDHDRDGTRDFRHSHPYIEHRINHEGGTITIMGVHLTIPENALPNDCVIAVTVINVPDMQLPGNTRRSRMTPLIKLEPEGLEFEKPALLTIPHSAIIPEPDRHSVVIFTGQKDEGSFHEGGITWTENTSIGRKLEQEKISLDIKILRYIFVNLDSELTEQKHIFRVVPFIDGILDANDDVLITVCFCKDSEEDYKLLLEDHRCQLSLGNYTTFQISRPMNDDRDSSIDLIISSPDRSYFLEKGESTKHVDVDRLCASSTVSHQFRFKRNHDVDTHMVDVNLMVSQKEKNKVDLVLKTKIKNILLSSESLGILEEKVHPVSDLPKYERLKGDISELLNKDNCTKLCEFFELESTEKDTIQKAAEPGKMLVKILDERKFIMPNKAFGLYEGLMAIPSMEAARLVLKYIDNSKRKNEKESESETEHNKKRVKLDEEHEVTSNLKTLIEEGYKKLDVQRALKLSHGKLDLGRRLLQLSKEEHEILPLIPGSSLYKEQYFDQNGGEMVIEGITLRVPAGALHTGRIVSLRVFADPAMKCPIPNSSLGLIPFVKIGPENISLFKPLILIIPHCAFTANQKTDIDAYSGVLQTDTTIKWSLQRKHLSCSMKSQNFEVEAQKPYLIGLHVPYEDKMKKHVCVLPFMKRESDVGDQLTIDLWFHNDDTPETDILRYEEVYQRKSIILHEPMSIELKSMTSSIRVSISSSDVQCSPSKVDIDMKTMWLQNRHKVQFHLQKKRIPDTVHLSCTSEINVGPMMWKTLFKMNIQFKIKDLLHYQPITSPFQHNLPESIIESFDELKRNLSERLNADHSTQLANIFQLPQDVITNIGQHNTPGTLLLEKLLENSLLSPTNITKLENALTEQGNEECAIVVRDFRKNNPVAQPTMCT